MSSAIVIRVFLLGASAINVIVGDRNLCPRWLAISRDAKFKYTFYAIGMKRSIE
jgi:hypothetical protein